MTISQSPIRSATASTPPIGWRIRSTPTIAVMAPNSATMPRLRVLLMNELASSRMPSTSRKMPAITARVSRLSPGLNRMITPATTLSRPTSTSSHEPRSSSVRLAARPEVSARLGLRVGVGGRRVEPYRRAVGPDLHAFQARASAHGEQRPAPRPNAAPILCSAAQIGSRGRVSTA